MHLIAAAVGTNALLYAFAVGLAYLTSVGINERKNQEE